MSRIIRQTFYDENGQPTKPSVMVPEGLVKYDKWGNMNYLASADGHGKLIDNPQTGWSIRRWTYDIKGNMLEVAVFDKEDKPCIDKEDESHKITYAYNKQNQNIEARYYSNPTDLRKTSYAIVKCQYDEHANLIEQRWFNYLDKAGNFLFNAVHRVTFSYDTQGNELYRKYYNVNNTLLLTEKKDKQTEKWIVVSNSTPTPSKYSPSSPSNWQENWQTVAGSCPYTIDSETEIASVTLTSNGCLLTVRFIETSKYSITDDDLETQKNGARKLAQYLKKQSGMPSNVTLTLIGVDKAKRELFRITH
jgi:hypothetical protein